MSADVTVLDISPAAIRLAWRELGTRAAQVHWLVADLRDWQPERRYAAWHDRAVLHFMTSAAEQQQYAQALDHATPAGQCRRHRLLRAGRAAGVLRPAGGPVRACRSGPGCSGTAGR